MKILVTIAASITCNTSCLFSVLEEHVVSVMLWTDCLRGNIERQKQKAPMLLDGLHFWRKFEKNQLIQAQNQPSANTVGLKSNTFTKVEFCAFDVE